MSLDILLISSGALCRNPRVAKEATALVRAGYRTQILTVAEAEPFEAQDRAFCAEAGLEKVTVPGAHGRGAGAWSQRWATRLARRAVPRGLEHPQALGPYLALRSAAHRLAARLTIVHTEAPLAVGRHLQRAGRVVAADLEDWHSRDLLPAARRWRPLRLLGQLERQHLHRAAYTSTTSCALAEALHRTYGGGMPVVLRNVFPLGPAPEIRSPDGPASLIWYSQTIGAGRGLEPFLAAWSRTTAPSRLTLLGDVTPSFRAELLSRLPASRQVDLVFAPRAPAPELPAILRQHDLGLALELAQPASRNLTITNKLFQYLEAGLGVIATPTAGQREVLHECPDVGALLDLADVPAAVRLLDQLLVDRTRLTSMSRGARQAAETMFCWELQAETFLACVRRVIAPPAVRGAAT